MSVEQYAAAAAAAAGMPEKLLMRSANAKAKAQGVPVEAILADMAGLPAPGAAPDPGPALAPTGTNGTVAAAAAPAPAPAAVPSGPPEGVRTQRLLTVVQAKAIQGVKAEPTDKVSTWPHLVAVEFVALLAVTALLIVVSVIINAPLLEAANFNLTPNPSKAPWYFLGLQELLSYFDPMIAGVLIPGLIGLVGLMAIPYIDRNPSVRPADRKLAIMLFTVFLMGAATLAIIGSFFRGPGFNFTYPWSDGVFFDDLKDWLE
ncbi:MAG: menaquinol-cytochrome c reductase cytochrome b subunit [Acidimicrobiia bacterium]|nr:menaquinol-cytochrome c reductase cytochrome b subunit [Acidimicrobiia bacterium]